MKKYFLNGKKVFYATEKDEIRYAEGVGYVSIPQSKAYDICAQNTILNKQENKMYFERVYPIAFDYIEGLELEENGNYEYRIKQK